MKIGINITLTLLVLGMAYYLYSSIKSPIEFNQAYQERRDAVIQRLKNIREGQLAYRDKTDTFANNFNTLIDALKKDSIPNVKIIGNPDDTTTVTHYDTTYQALWKKAYNQPIEFDSLRYIPYSNKEEYKIQAGKVKRNKVTIEVFKVSAPDSLWLNGLNTEYLEKRQTLYVGSMEEGTYSGNWGE